MATSAAERQRKHRAKVKAEKELRQGLFADATRDCAPRRPRTASERQRKHRDAEREIGPLPIADIDFARRESCRHDLLKFGCTYFQCLLDHEPSETMVSELIRPLEQSIIHGGKEVIQFPRSTGKSTWIKIAVLWAFAYGYKRFIVVIGATAALSRTIFDELFDLMGGDEADEFAQDFPGLVAPISSLQGEKKNAARQTCNGVLTGMVFRDTRFQLPAAVDEDGEFIEPSHGAILVCCSMGGSIKGLVHKKERPDMFFLDDPQNEKMAKSKTLTDEGERFIIGSVLGLGGQTRDKTALMAITPIRYGDLAFRFADRKRNGDWHVASVPYVSGWTEAHSRLMPAYVAAYNEDVAIQDKSWALSKQFYLDHKSEFADLVLLDPKNQTPSDIDAIHHLLNLRVEFKDQFESEFQMNVVNESAGEQLEPERVMGAVSGYPRFALPPGTLQAVAFCDVNTQADSGLRWGIMAFGPNRVASLVAYGRYPEYGHRLYEKDATTEAKSDGIIAGIKTVVGVLKRAPLYRYDTGETVKLRAIAFDGGYAEREVDMTLRWIGQNVNLGGTHLYWTRGYGWSRYNEKARGVTAVHDHNQDVITTTRDKRSISYIAVHADYWREVMQKAFRSRYPARGSLSIFGSTPSEHALFAEEVCYEKLIRVYRDPTTLRQAWEWENEKPGYNHSADVLYNCLMLGQHEGLYSAIGQLTDVAPTVASPGETVHESAAPVVATVAPKRPVRKVVRHYGIFKPIKRPGSR